MIKMKLINLLPALCCLAFISRATAQEPDDKTTEAALIKPLMFKLNEEGSSYLRLMFWNQFWVTLTENNNGTLGVDGKPLGSHAADIALRRSRILLFAKLSSRFLILTHFGIDNQSFAAGGVGSDGKKPQIYMHDAYAEYTAVDKKLIFDVGLRYYGLSRMSNANPMTIATIDFPTVSWPNMETTDQLGRQFGVYAKGQLGRFEYNLGITKPFVYGEAPASPAGAAFKTAKINGEEKVVAQNVRNNNMAYTGYFKWMFMQPEDITLPFQTGTYLGAKDVFNLGAGFYYHPGAFGALRSVGASELRFYDQLNLGFDAFFEKALSRSVLHLYSVFYVYKMGPNFYRNIGTLNSFETGQSAAENPLTSATGFGNSQPAIGTGSVWYTEAGYIFPKFKNGSALMPYVTYQLKNFEGIGAVSHQGDVGLNYFISGHFAKISLQYSLRPAYVQGADGLTPHGSKGQWILQTQLFF